MAEFFLASMGRLTNAIVDLYLQHQVVLNTLVVAYGLVLALAHTNLKRIQSDLAKLSGTDDVDSALFALATDSSGELLRQIVKRSNIPIIASPYFFAIHRINARTIIAVVGRKKQLPRQRVAELLELERSHTQRSTQ